MLNVIEGTTDEGDHWVSIETDDGTVIVHAVAVAGTGYEGWHLPSGERVHGSLSALLARALSRHWKLVA